MRHLASVSRWTMGWSPVGGAGDAVTALSFAATEAG